MMQRCGEVLAVVAIAAAFFAATGFASSHKPPHKPPPHKPKKPRAPKSVVFDLTVTGRFNLGRDDSYKEASYCTDGAGNALYVTDEDHWSAHLNFTLEFKKIRLSLRTNSLQTLLGTGDASTAWSAHGGSFSDILTGDCSDGPQLATENCSGTIVDPHRRGSIIADTTFVTATTDRFRAVVDPFGNPEYQPDQCLTTDGTPIAVENITGWTDPDAGTNPFLIDWPPPGVDFPVSDIVHSGTHSEDDNRGSIDCTNENDVQPDDVCQEDESGTQKFTVKTLKVNY